MLVDANRLGWSAYLENFQEGKELHDILGDAVSKIESNSFESCVQGWEELTILIQKDPRFANLLSDSSSFACKKIAEVKNAAMNYMKSVTLEVQQPNNNSQYIPLYRGNSSVQGGNINENFQDYGTDGWGNKVPEPATLYEAITGQVTSLITDAGDCYFNNPNVRQGLWSNWSLHGNLQFNCQWDGNPNGNGEFCSACGSLGNWAPFIHLNTSGASTSGLNKVLNSY